MISFLFETLSNPCTCWPTKTLAISLDQNFRKTCLTLWFVLHPIGVHLQVNSQCTHYINSHCACHTFSGNLPTSGSFDCINQGGVAVVWQFSANQITANPLSWTAECSVSTSSCWTIGWKLKKLIDILVCDWYVYCVCIAVEWRKSLKGNKLSQIGHTFKCQPLFKVLWLAFTKGASELNSVS